MFSILKKEKLNDYVSKMVLLAPLIAKKALPGQFIILRVHQKGERIPLTIADFDRERGTITIVYQVIGTTTRLLDQLNAGETILDLAGPLGKPTEISGAKKVAVIGGGVGCAIAYPQAKAIYDSGADIDIVAGFRSKELVILEDDMSKVCRDLVIVTDDGSNGKRGFVTDALRELIDSGRSYDLVVAIGPIPMMKAVCELTKVYAIKTIVSMNPIMIDGTGMCGGCRLIVGGKTKFACVDGPDFDGHEVDFGEAMKRLNTYKEQEKVSLTKHDCNLLRGGGNDA